VASDLPVAPVIVKQPGFEVPLSADDLRLLGLFNAIWSQVDFLVGVATMVIEKFDLAHLKSDEEPTTGRKLGQFKKTIKKLPDGPLKEACRQFYRATFPLNKKRNHLSHGIWVVDATSQQTACHHDVHGKFFAADLPDLCSQSADQSVAIRDIFSQLTGQPILSTTAPRRFSFVPSGPSARTP